MEQLNAGTVPGPRGAAPARYYPWLVFALLVGLMMSNYLSRQVVTVLFPFLKAEWQLSDTELGSLVSVVALTAGLLALPLSMLVDRYGRVSAVTAMAVLWGGATLLCARADNFMLLLAARTLLGVALAAFSSAGGAILLGLFPARRHSTVMGAFLASALLGSVLSAMVGGTLAAGHGWRYVFVVFGVLALVAAVLFRLVAREPAAAKAAAAPLPMRAALRAMLAVPTANYVFLGAGLQMFTVGATLAWLPSYLNRYYGMSASEAGMKAGIYVLISALGMMLGGAVVDRLAHSTPARRLSITAAFAGGTMALFVAAFALPAGTAQLVLIGAGMLLSGAHTGPSSAIAPQVHDARIHATVLAVLALSIGVLGMAFGPFVTGLLADRTDLKTALAIMPAASLLAAVCFLRAKRHFAADVARVSHAAGKADTVDASATQPPPATAQSVPAGAGRLS